MNTARIMVLTTAVGAGGIAACPASGVGSHRPSSAGPAVDLHDRARQNSGPMSLALNRITGLNFIRSDARDDQAYRRGDSIDVTTQK